MGYPASMSERTPEQPPEKLVIEFPDDPALPELPDADDVHASVDTEEPPDTHSIRERWARCVPGSGSADGEWPNGSRSGSRDHPASVTSQAAL